MSKLANCLLNLPELTLAKRYSPFIASKDELPDDDLIHLKFKENDLLEDALDEIKELFIIWLETALLSGASEKSQELFRKDLKIEVLLDHSVPEQVSEYLVVTFRDKVISDPDITALEELYRYIAGIDNVVHLSGARCIQAFDLSISEQVYNELREVVEEGLYEPIVDSSCGLSKSIIIDLVFIRDLAKTNQNSKNCYDKIWEILLDYKPTLVSLVNCYPDILTLTALIED